MVDAYNGLWSVRYGSEEFVDERSLIYYQSERPWDPLLVRGLKGFIDTFQVDLPIIYEYIFFLIQLI